jgi:hypothetical protein
MRNIFKLIILFILFATTSCGSDDSKPSNGESKPIIFAMKGSLDSGDLKLMRNLAGTNTADFNSTEFGINNFTLNGFYNNSSPNARVPIQDKVVEINLAIPKNNIIIGEHLFNNILVADEYFADMNIKLNGVTETVNTVSGKINVITYDELEGKITGTFELTTTNGTNPLTHSFTGDFDYMLIDN